MDKPAIIRQTISASIFTKKVIRGDGFTVLPVKLSTRYNVETKLPNHSHCKKNTYS